MIEAPSSKRSFPILVESGLEAGVALVKEVRSYEVLGCLETDYDLAGTTKELRPDGSSLRLRGRIDTGCGLNSLMIEFPCHEGLRTSLRQLRARGAWF